MAKNQAKQGTEDTKQWVTEEVGDFDEASNNATDETSNDPAMVPAKIRMAMRHKIEDLIENRRIKAQIGDYETFDVGDEKPRRMH